MRVIGSILLSVLLLGATWGYTHFADSVRREPVTIQAELDDADWRIKITRTFDFVPDPDAEIPSLHVQLKGQDVFKSSEKIPRDAELEIGELPEVEQGDNELFVAANLTTLDDFDFDLDQNKALRVEIYRGGKRIKDQTIWSEPGVTAIEETVLFKAPRATAATDHDHD